MLTQEAQGNHMQVTLLTVHSQDHLMTCIAFTDLAKRNHRTLSSRIQRINTTSFLNGRRKIFERIFYFVIKRTLFI